MARATFLSFPAAGHINPTLPVVAELVRRGEHVDYHATEAYRPRIEATGARFLSYGNETMSIGRQVDPSVLGAIPADFIVRPHVPQLRVLERCALFLTHAGMNSVNEALYHGVPLLLRPAHADQFVVARRVAELGAGHILDGGTLTAASLRSSARRLLAHAGYRSAAERVAASLRETRGVSGAADDILAYRPDASNAIAPDETGR